jgi:hypothetical protein
VHGCEIISGLSTFGFNKKIKDLIKPKWGYTNPEWRMEMFEPSGMHEQQFYQLSYINILSVLMPGSIPVSGR